MYRINLYISSFQLRLVFFPLLLLSRFCLVVISFYLPLAGSLHARSLTVWAMGEEAMKIPILAREFEKENPGVEIITQGIPWTAAHEKLLTAVVGGIPPDVSQMGTTWMAELQATGALYPLNGFLKDSLSVKKEDFFEGSWQTCEIDGDIYGIPWYADTRVLFYRKDILKEAGFPYPPQTWDELKKVCRALAKDMNNDGKPDRYGISLGASGWGDFAPFVWQNGGDLLHPSEDPFIESFKFYLSFFREKLTSGGGSDVSLFLAFKQGYCSMFFSGPWMIKLMDQEMPQLKGLWDVSLLPKKKSRTSFAGGSNLVIFKESKNKELAWKFIEFMSRPSNQIGLYRLVGDLPASRLSWNDPVFRESSKLNVFRKQLEDSRSPPTIPEFEQVVISIIQHTMDKVIHQDASQDKEIPMILKSAESEIQKIISGKKNRLAERTVPYVAMIIGFISVLIAVGGYVIYGRKHALILKPQPFLKTWKDSLNGYLFILPALFILGIFFFLPILISFFMSLTNLDIYNITRLDKIQFIGFSGYSKVLQDPVFWKSLQNTLKFTAAGVPLTISLALLCAWALNQVFLRFRTLLRGAYFAPFITNIVAVSVLWSWLYHGEYGLLNWILKLIKVPPVNWLSDPHTALPSLTLLAIWRNFGYNMVILLAGLQSIPHNLHEAACIDGANEWQSFWHITLPGLRPILFFVTIMATIGFMQFFAEPYVMTGGGPADSTLSVVLYLYNHGFRFLEFGYASTVSYLLFTIIFILTWIQLKFRQRAVEGVS